MVLEMDACHLIKRYHVPHSDEANLTPRQVVEEVGHCGLTSGYQDAVRAHFFVDVALARISRTQLADVVVVLHKGDHPRQEMPLHSRLQRRGLHAGRAQEHVDPLFTREMRAPLAQFVHVHVRHLDGLELPNQKRRSPLSLFVEILERHQRPDSAHQELLVLLHGGGGHLNTLDTQTQELRLVDIALFVELHVHLVDDLVGALLANERLDFLGLIGAHEVFCQDMLDRVQSVGHHLFVL